MKKEESSFLIEKCGRECFVKNKIAMVQLYLQAFTTGEYAQYVSPKSAENQLNMLFESGEAYLLKTADNLAGFVICVSFAFDKEFPTSKHPSISLETTLYIAELVVEASFRGKGLGRKLMKEALLQAENGGYRQVAIRVWDENRAALQLYRSLGFETIDSIIQIKQKSANENFEMRKLYLIKQL